MHVQLFLSTVFPRHQAQDVANATVYNGFQRISRNRSSLASTRKALWKDNFLMSRLYITTTLERTLRAGLLATLGGTDRGSMETESIARQRHHADGLLTRIVRDNAGHYRGQTEPSRWLTWQVFGTVAEAQWQVEERLREIGHDCKTLGCADWFEPERSH